MKAYLSFAKAYLKHLLQTIALARHPDGVRWYIHPDIVQPWIDDAVILDKEIRGETFPPDVIQAIWSRAHDRGFI